MKPVFLARLRRLVLATLPMCVGAPALLAQSNTYLDGDNRTTAPMDSPSVLTIVSGTATENGSVTGAGSLTKTGAGTLILTGNHTYTGATQISAGTLRLSGSGRLADTTAVNINAGATLDLNGVSDTIGSLGGAGSVTLGSGTLTVGGDHTGTIFSGVISGSGSLNKIGFGVLRLTGINTYTGGTTISSGTLQLGDGTAAILAVKGDIAVDHGHLVFNYSNAVVHSGVISGSGPFVSMTKKGDGWLTLTGENTFSGVTYIETGSLGIGGVNGTSGSIAGNIVNHGALVFWRKDTQTHSGDISGSGSVANSGNGTLVVTGSLTHTGGTSVTRGTLQIGDGGTSGSIAGDIVNNSSLVFNRDDAVTYDNVISGSGSLAKRGDGTLTLTASHTYTGDTVVDEGALVAAYTGEKGTFATGSTVKVNDGATLVVNGDSLGWGSGASRLVLDGGALVSSSTTGLHTTLMDVTLAGARITTSGTGRFLLNGPLETQAGDTASIIETRLELREGATFSVASGDTPGGVDLILSNDVHGPGALVKNGDGVMLLSGAATHSGGTVVNAGALLVNGSVSSGPVTVFSGARLGGSGSIHSLTTIRSGAVLAPGTSPGTITFTAGLALADGAILNFELGSSSSDMIRVSGGTLSADGTITVNLFDSGDFTAGVYTLIDATNATLSSIGATSFELGAVIAGYDYAITRFGDTYILTASAVPEPAAFAALLGLATLCAAVAFRRSR